MDEEYERYRREQASGYLSRVRDAKRHIDAMNAEVDELREMAGGLRGIDYSKDIVATSPSADAIPDAVARILEIIEQRAEYIRDYACMVEQCVQALDKLGGVESDILRYRYVCDWRWEQIAARTHYSEQWLYELHNRALCSFYDCMPASGRDPIQRAI